MSTKKSATPWFELDSSPVQQIVPPGLTQRFEGVDFAGCGNILAIATADANAILLYRRRPDGRFDEAPYQTIGGGSQIEYPHDVAFSRAKADELLAVAQRPGRITIHARTGADGHYSAVAISEIGGMQSGLAYSDAVAFVPPDESHLASCSLERGTISFFRRTAAAPPAFEATPVFQLKHRSIFHPDGLAFSGCGGWLAVANHGKQTVAIFRRDARSTGGALAFRRRPVAVIADPSFRYPHSVAFTPDTNHLLVTNAGANYVCAYAPARGWFGRTTWSQTPVAQMMVHDDAAFHEVNTADKMEGGPKGIAVHRDTVAVCSPQIGVKIYSFREGWRWAAGSASAPARQDAGGGRAARRRRDRHLAAPAEHHDLGDLPVPLDHVVVAVEQARDHLRERARIGRPGRCVERDGGAIFRVEVSGHRREHVGDRGLLGGDAHRRRSALDQDAGAGGAGRAARDQRQQQGGRPAQTGRPGDGSAISGDRHGPSA
jgi:hypothetical protein